MYIQDFREGKLCVVNKWISLFFYSPCWGTTIIPSNTCNGCLIIGALTTTQFSLLCNSVYLILYKEKKITLWNVTKAYLKFTFLSIWPSLTKTSELLSLPSSLFNTPTKYKIKHIIDSRSMLVTYLDLAWAPQIFTRGWKFYLIYKTC